MRSLTAGPSRLRHLDATVDLRPARWRDHGAAPVGHRLAARATSHPAHEDWGVLRAAAAPRPRERAARVPAARTACDAVPRGVPKIVGTVPAALWRRSAPLHARPQTPGCRRGPVGQARGASPET